MNTHIHPATVDGGRDKTGWPTSVLEKILALVFIMVIGIPNQITDYTHWKRKSYEHGNAWGHYSKLSKEGSWEGRFMMWSGYLGIYFIVGVICSTFYLLTR